ncbi:protein of unknown function [Candidatus Nitrosocosmicus franklandus]|uniref:Uncharacterized protein n=1 Tax=Candidatus Nitrosocosmicus franklandianus TaxID=1798806 RepID=A0A484IBA2_9ARCH|nr:protein of unknown function [Candidatus Nitrosocosmicus franklandus]
MQRNRTAECNDDNVHNHDIVTLLDILGTKYESSKNIHCYRKNTKDFQNTLSEMKSP